LSTIADIKKALGGVLIPGPLRDIVSLNLLKDFTLSYSARVMRKNWPPSLVRPCLPEFP
jgi:hypothetical protein